MTSTQESQINPVDVRGEVPPALVSFEHLDGSKGFNQRTRICGLTVNFIALVISSIAVYVFTRSTSLVALLAAPFIFIICIPLIHAFMSKRMLDSNKKLWELVDRKGSFELTDAEFSQAASWLLRHPWTAIVRVLGIWTIIGLPLFYLIFRFLSNENVSFLKTSTPVLLCLPFIVVTILLNFEAIQNPYVRALFACRGPSAIDYPFALTTAKKILALQFLTGPYLFFVYLVFLFNEIDTSHDTSFSNLFPLHSIFSLLFVGCWMICYRYSKRSIDVPFGQLLESLRGRQHNASNILRVDEWLVASELLRQKAEAERLLRMSESKFRVVLEVMPIGALVLRDNQVELVNHAMCVLAAKGKDELIGKQVHDLLGISQKQWQELNVADSRESVSLQLQTGSGFTYVELLSRTFETEWGERFLLMVQDVTERKRLERLKQEFFAMISHELRTPLTAVRSFLSLLKQGVYGELTGGGPDRNKGAIGNVDKLIKLITDLLDAEKLEAGQFECTPMESSARQVIERALETLDPLAIEEGIELRSQIADCPLTVDEDRIAQVLVNLIGNAIKYAQKKPVTVASKIDGDAVEFTVEDNGPGIPDSSKTEIFEKFRQVKGQRDKTSGTGLGLAIAKALVQQHGGTIGVKDTQGGGATFWFKLPRT